jgi:hypothetical protein
MCWLNITIRSVKNPKSRLKPYPKGASASHKFSKDKNTVQNLVTMKFDTVYLSKLKEFEGYLTEENATELAIRDTSLFLVEKVRRRFGTPKGKKSQLLF